MVVRTYLIHLQLFSIMSNPFPIYWLITLTRLINESRSTILA